jgi:P-type Cu+ transporter
MKHDHSYASDGNRHDHVDHGHAAIPDATTPSATDPVCGMTVPLDGTKAQEAFGGASFHFCSDECHDEFTVDPRFHASGNAASKKDEVAAGTAYTCPIRPGIRQEGPGSDPIRGVDEESAAAGINIGRARAPDNQGERQ